MTGARFVARYSMVVRTEPVPACIRASTLVGKTDGKKNKFMYVCVFILKWNVIIRYSQNHIANLQRGGQILDHGKIIRITRPLGENHQPLSNKCLCTSFLILFKLYRYIPQTRWEDQMM